MPKRKDLRLVMQTPKHLVTKLFDKNFGGSMYFRSHGSHLHYGVEAGKSKAESRVKELFCYSAQWNFLSVTLLIILKHKFPNTRHSHILSQVLQIFNNFSKVCYFFIWSPSFSSFKSQSWCIGLFLHMAARKIWVCGGGEWGTSKNEKQRIDGSVTYQLSDQVIEFLLNIIS